MTSENEKANTQHATSAPKRKNHQN